MASFQYRKRYGLHAIVLFTTSLYNFKFQYRKRYGLHAIGECDYLWDTFGQFQYRKRYGLHAIIMMIKHVGTVRRFNTASGMDCMQYPFISLENTLGIGFNTASGMDCMQYVLPPSGDEAEMVSIPQAVWIACN